MSMILTGRKGGKSGGGSGHTATEASDTLRSRSSVQIVEIVSEGEVEGLVNGEQSIFFDGTPLQNYDGSYNFTNVIWTFTPGTPDQAALAGFVTAQSEVPVNIAIKQANPQEFTVNDTTVDLVKVRLGFPALQRTDTTNGDTLGTTLQYKIEVRQLPSGAWTPAMLAQRWSTVSPTPTGGQTVTGMYRLRVRVTVTPAKLQTVYDSRNGPRYTNHNLPGYILVEKRVNGGAWTTVGQYKYGGSATGTGFAAIFSLSASKSSNYSTSMEFNTLKTDVVEVRASAVTTSTSTPDTPASITSLGVDRLDATEVVTLNDKTASRFEREHVIDPRAMVGEGPWMFRVTRITADSTSNYLQNSLELASYSLVQTDKFRYPNSALIGMQLDSEQFSSVPTRGYHMRLMRIAVPSNYDPINRTYDGLWDLTFKVAWSNNPAWVLWDMITKNRYGAGDRINAAMLDKAVMYKIAQYCDELVPDGEGGLEPRFTCNAYIQEEQEAVKLLTDLASVFMGMAYYSTDKLRFAQDAPRDPKYQFTNANVIDGEFHYSTSPDTTRFNTVIVGWNNPKNLYKQAFEYVTDPELVKASGNVIKQTQTVAFGCTSRAQAHRVGRHLLYTNYWGGRMVTFKTGADGAVPSPGDIILVQDSMKAGDRRGGRLWGVNGLYLTLDSVIAVPVGSTVTVIDPAAGLQTRTVTEVSGSTIKVDVEFSPQPTKDAVFTVAASDIQPQKFMAVNVTEDEKHQYTVSALTHLDGKFAYIDDGIDIVLPDTSNLDSALQAPPSPTNVNISDTLYLGPGNTVKAKVMVHWSNPGSQFGVRGYRVRYRKDSSAWVVLGETSTPGVDILDVTDGVPYTIEISSVNALGMVTSSPDQYTYNPVGFKAPPADVTGFSAQADPQMGTLLRWNQVDDLDIDYYEIRKGASWAAGTLVARVKATQYLYGFNLTDTLWVRAVDTSGNYSVDDAYLTLSLTAAPAPVVISAFVGKTVTLSWPATMGSFNVDSYEISASGFTTQRIKGTAFTLDATWVGAKTFTVKAIDLGGNVGAGGTATVTVSVSGAPAPTATFEGDSVVLSWAAVQGSLPTAFYNIQKAGVTVATIQGTRWSQKADWLGAKVFSVAAVDASGNVGAYGNVTSTVTAAAAPVVSAAFSGKDLVLSWTAVQGSLLTAEYEVSAPGMTAQRIKGTTLTLGAFWLGAKTFTVKAVDTAGNLGAGGTVTATVTAAAAPTVSSSFSGDSVTLSWAAIAGTLPTAFYNVQRGGVTIATIQGTQFTQKVDWLGAQTFGVAAVDALGDVGAYGTAVVTVSAAPAPSVSGAFAGKTLTLGWTAVQGSVSTVEYEISAPDFTTSRVKGTTLTVDVDWIGTKTFTVKAVDTAGNLGAGGAYAATVLAATAPTVAATFVGDSVLLSWAALQGTLPTSVYQIRKAGVVIATIQGTTWQQQVDWSGAKLFEVAAVDVNGNVGAYGSVSPSVLVPGAPTVQQEVIDNNVLLRWSDATATLPISTYEVRRGTDWATAKVVGKTLSRFSALFESVAGTFTYLVGAYDSAGNLGAIGSVSAVVSQPPDYALQLDFNSSLNGTLSNAKFDVDNALLMPLNLTETIEQHFERGILAYPQDFTNSVWTKNNTSVSADVTTAPDGTSRADKLIESATSNYHTMNQALPVSAVAGGQYTYSVYAKSAGQSRKLNLLGTYAVFGTGCGACFDIDTGAVLTVGVNTSNAAITSVGNGWYLCRITLTAIASGTAHCLCGISNSSAIYPTYAGDGVSGFYVWGYQALVGSSYLPQWFSPNDQINAGFPYFAQPSLSSGYYEETLDYGTVLSATKVTVTPTIALVAGASNYSVMISVRASTLDAWTDYPNQSSVYATNFRYVKVRVTVTSTDGTTLMKLSALNIRLDSKLKNDAGTGTAVSTDSGGTVVYFNIPFVDVWSITVTPKGNSAPVIPIYDFVDAPNPTSFKVLLYNTSGARVSGDFSWAVKGV